MTKRRQLGEILVRAGMINEIQLARALGDQKQWGGRLGSILVRMGFISEDDLAAVLEQQLGIKWLSLKDLDISDEAVRAVKQDVAKKYIIMPVTYDGKTVTLAMTDPMDLKTVDTLEFVLGKRIKPVIATKSDIDWAVSKYYDKLSLDAVETIALPKEPEAPFEEIDAKDMLEGLIGLLIEKGVMTKQELDARVRRKR